MRWNHQKTVHRRSLSRRKQTENSSRKQPDLLRRLGKCFQKVPDSLFQNGNPRGEIRFWQDIRFLKTGAEIRWLHFRESVFLPDSLRLQKGFCAPLHRMRETVWCRICFRREETSRCTIQSMRHCCLSIACICIMKQQKIWSLSGKCIRWWSGSWMDIRTGQSLGSTWIQTGWSVQGKVLLRWPGWTYVWERFCRLQDTESRWRSMPTGTMP